MKFSIFAIISLFLMTSCSQQIIQSDPRSRIVHIGSQSMAGVHGKGVILRSGLVLTSRHVVEKCTNGVQKNESGIYSAHGCFILFPDTKKSSIESIEFPDSSRDMARVSYLSAGTSSFSEISPKGIGQLTLGENIRVYTQTDIIEGKILEFDSSYIGYDSTLSGKLLSGSVVTDIILPPGESGMPIWTRSGELIGVVSAVDTVGKRSYIVE